MRHKVICLINKLSVEDGNELFDQYVDHDEFIFVNDIYAADYIIINQDTIVQIPKELYNKVVYFGREPFTVTAKGFEKFAFKRIRHFTHFEIKNGIMPVTWWVDCRYDDMKELQPNWVDLIKSKTYELSVIDSGKGITHQHEIRKRVIHELLNTANCEYQIDIFGNDKYSSSSRYRGPLPYRNKKDGLVNYKYNLAIENSRLDFYFTEKFCDPLMYLTKPIYLGCKDIDKFFPDKSYCLLNPDRDIVQQIFSYLETDKIDYDILLEARELIIKKYGFNNQIVNVISSKPETKKNYLLRCFRALFRLAKHRLEFWHK